MSRAPDRASPTRPPAPPARWRAWPPSVLIALIYLAARVLTTLFLWVAAEGSGVESRHGPQATVGDLATGWDAQWYWLIAEQGYPSDLPRTDGGTVAENAWAFMPLYPLIARVVGMPFGSWGAGAVVVSLVAGYLACLVLYRLLAPRIGRSAGMWAVAFFAAGPLGALFQVGYAEALFLLLLFLALAEVTRRRFGWLYLLIPVAGFTRPGILAFALFLGLYGIWRWLRRRVDPLPARQIVHILALGALATAVGFSWQIIAAVVTGDPTAYLETELAWRRNWSVGEGGGFVPFSGWVEAARFWFAYWGLPGWLGVLVLLLLVAGAAALLWAPAVRRLGPELRLWSASYLIYLLAVFFPQSSTLRLLVPVSPLWGAVAVPRALGYRLTMLVAGLALQLLWIWNVYGLARAFWQVP